jgi:hypothetical protein
MEKQKSPESSQSIFSYCSKIYQQDSEKGHRMFIALLRVYLQPAGGASPLIEPALELLARHGWQIDASEVRAIFWKKMMERLDSPKRSPTSQ